MGFVFLERKTLRKSTAEKSVEARQREQERDARIALMKEIAARKNVTEVRRLTQEELLEEAKETEILNLKALGSDIQ